MSEIPQDVLTATEVFEWYRISEELSALKVKEALLRARVFRHLVPVPVEGTNSVDLSKHPVFAGMDTGGGVLKATHVIRRDIDQGALTTLTPQLQEAKLPLTDLIKWEPSLVIKAYRKLTKEEMQLFDQALIVKPGSPQVDIVIPKKRGS